MFKELRQISVFDIVLPVLDKEGKNKEDFFMADTIGQKNFAQNFGGYPRSDIAIIDDQNNVQVAKALVAQLVDYGTDKVANKGMSDNDIRLAIQSRYQQTASEVMPFIEERLRIRDANIERARAAAAARSSASASASDPNSVIDNV